MLIGHSRGITNNSKDETQNQVKYVNMNERSGVTLKTIPYSNLNERKKKVLKVHQENLRLVQRLSKMKAA